MAIRSLEEITQPHERIIAALDYDYWAEAYESLVEYATVIGLAKVNSVADRMGLDQAVSGIGHVGALTMIDYKFHDIDDTMRRRTREATLAGGSMITIHASNTTKAMHEAVVGVEEALALEPRLMRPWILGVTVLTSISDIEKDKGGNPVETCTSIYGADRATKVRQFAHKAADAGLDGIVCSPLECESVKSDPHTANLKTVIPAIRPPYAVTPDEQATAVTPTVAIQSGADFLVIGRPLTQAKGYGMTGLEAAQTIGHEIGEA